MIQAIYRKIRRAKPPASTRYSGPRRATGGVFLFCVNSGQRADATGTSAMRSIPTGTMTKCIPDQSKSQRMSFRDMQPSQSLHRTRWVAMNEYEELLDKAAACLKDASKIEDPGVRAIGLALVYHSQKVAQAEILREQWVSGESRVTGLRAQAVEHWALRPKGCTATTAAWEY
jgi:hypothetical protein